MKTFVRLIRRYVLAAVGIVLLLVFLGLGLLVLLGWQETTHLPQRTYASSEIADAMVETPAGLALGAAHTPEEWMACSSSGLPEVVCGNTAFTPRRSTS